MEHPASHFYKKLSVLWKTLERADDETAQTAEAFLEALGGREGKPLAPFFQKAVALVFKEYESALKSERGPAFRELDNFLTEIENSPSPESNQEKLATLLWAAFFPEASYPESTGKGPLENLEKEIETLRRKRRVTIEKLCPHPIKKPAEEIIFTSNVLLSPPLRETETDAPDEPPSERKNLIRRAALAGQEKQLYWYDHPIPIGTPENSDEAVYGLKGLAEMLRYEKKRRTVSSDARLTVLLSVSVTHKGLRELAKPWLKAQLADKNLEGLDVYAFTEEEALSIAEALKPFVSGTDFQSLQDTFGVDGEYGRHYSFLKALPALWAVIENPSFKATFKIDLDQIFPQETLVKATGKSALEHFCSPLWGARAVDSSGGRVDLGMMAGALVNEKDIKTGLFTPDIPWPETMPEGENVLFFKQLPMAISTRAEMMSRYGKPGMPDGEKTALQRIHVTGGTNGIRFDALRKHRPFTPSFVGRAEDQAYIFSVFSNPSERAALRYVHASGLIMRHDKEAFAGPAIKAGKAGAYVGDLLRLFIFSRYADLITDNKTRLKETLDPFTGCFITPLPFTMAFLKLTLRLYTNDGGSTEERQRLLKLAEERLSAWVNGEESMISQMRDVFLKERAAWNAYYNALDELQNTLASPDAIPNANKDGGNPAETASSRLKEIFKNARVV